MKALRSQELHRRGALAEHRIGQPPAAAQPQQHRRMAQPVQAAVRRQAQRLARQRVHGHRRGRRGVGRLVEEEIPHDAGAGRRRLGGLGRGVAEAAAAGLWRAGVVAGGGTGKGLRIETINSVYRAGRRAGGLGGRRIAPDCPELKGWMGNDPCFKVVISLLIVRNLSWILCQTCFLCSNRKASFTRVSTWRASGRSLFLRTTASSSPPPCADRAGAGWRGRTRRSVSTRATASW